MAYTETKSRDQLKKTFTAFLDHCQSGLEDEVTRSADNGAMPFYPLGIDSEQREALEAMGEEIIRQMPDDLTEQVMTQSGATSLIAKLYPKDREPYIIHNERNAGYIIYCVSFSAMESAGKTAEEPKTFADFCSGVPKALKMEFPFYDWDAEPGPQPGPAPKARTEVLPTLPELKPKNAIMPHTLVSNSLTKPELWGGEWQQMSLPGYDLPDLKNKKLKTYFSLEWNSDTDITFSRKQTPYDGSVLNAAYAFYDSGNHIFTSRQLCAQMKALESDSSGIDETSIKKITDSIEKERRTMAKIDSTDAFTKRGITDYTAKIEDYLLPLRKIYVEGKGKKSGERMEAYQFRGEPPILAHARALKQISTIPMEYLKIEGMSITDDVVVLRDYLISRVDGARNKRLSRKILYSTIYEQLEIYEPSIYSYLNTTNEETGEIITAEEAYKKDLDRYRHDTKRIRDKVKKILTYWIKAGFIRGFTETKKGKAFEAVTLSFERKKKKKEDEEE